jgi:hypothetical protein
MSCVHLAACSLTWAELYCTDEWWTHCESTTTRALPRHESTARRMCLAVCVSKSLVCCLVSTCI